MKKRWLFLGLATVMSLGLVACGKDGDDDADSGNGGGSSITGEQVTAEQWETAFTNADCTHVVVDLSTGVTEDGETSSGSSHIVYAPNTRYREDVGVEDGEQETYKTWNYEKNGISYEYELDDGETTSAWDVSDSFSLFSFENIGNTWEDVTEIPFIDELSTYTYDAAKTVYRKEYAGGIYNAWMEILIHDGKVYSVEYKLTYTKESDTGWYSAKAKFKEETITLPAQDDLNALIASGVAISKSAVIGTYELYSLTFEGTTYYEGDRCNGVLIKPETLKIGLADDFTAHMLYIDETKEGTWAISGSSIVLTFDGENYTFDYEHARLTGLMDDANWELIRYSGNVNPDDFVNEFAKIAGTYYYYSSYVDNVAYKIGDYYNVYDVTLTEEFVTITISANGDIEIKCFDTFWVGTCWLTEENNHTFIDFDVGYSDYFEFTSDGRLFYTDGYNEWMFVK